MKKRYFSTGEVAEKLGVSPVTVGRWIDSGQLKGVKTVGGHRKIDSLLLERFMKDNGYLETGGKILIIDDEREVCESLKRFIKQAFPDFSILTAGDGFEGGELTAVHQPELIMLDIFLPGINGVEVCRRIKEKYPQIRIIGISGYANDKLVDDFLEAGGEKVLKKPISPKMIKAILAEL